MMMEAQEVARQLKQPEGQAGIDMAKKMNEGNAHLIDLTLNNLRVEPGATVLEIGFGNGSHLMKLMRKAEHNLTYEGLDLSPTMVEEASKLNKKLVDKGNVKFTVGNISSIPFDNETFDHIFSVNTIYFWEDAAHNLAEIFRVLKPGGTVHIGYRPKSYLQNLEFIKYGFTLYSQNEGLDLLKKAGFVQVRSTLKEEPPTVFVGQEVALAGLCISGKKPMLNVE